MRKRRQFPNEFKLEAIKLAQSGEIPVAQVAQELDLCESVLRRWLARSGAEPGGAGVTPDEHQELIRLRRENRRLVLERDILKKALGIFSKELP